MNEGYRQFIGGAENPNLAARGAVQVVALAEPAFPVEEERLSRALRGRSPRVRRRGVEDDQPFPDPMGP
jgi:hypothetical protein